MTTKELARRLYQTMHTCTFDDEIQEAFESVITQDRQSACDELVRRLEKLRQEIPTYLNKRGHHTNSAHRKIKYNQAIDQALTIVKEVYKVTE